MKRPEKKWLPLLVISALSHFIAYTQSEATRYGLKDGLYESKEDRTEPKVVRNETNEGRYESKDRLNKSDASRCASEAARYAGEWFAAPANIPNPKVPDAPLAGNGDVGIVYAGTPRKQQFYFSKNDFWKSQPGYPDGGVCLAGGLTLSIDELKDASVYMKQQIGNGLISSTYKTAAATFRQKSWVCATRNLVVIELSVEGKPVHVDASLWSDDHLGATVRSGCNRQISWVTRNFDAPILDWSSHVAIAMKVIGAAGNSFLLRPGTPVYIAVSLKTNHETPGYLTAGIRDLERLDKPGFTRLWHIHERWWKNFWSKSSIHLDDTVLEKYYYGSLYLLASCSRSGHAAPGLWGNSLTMDATYAWQGDYHTNYNYEAPWWGAYSSNHIDITDPYDAPVLDYMAAAKRHARQFLGIRGVYYPVGLGPRGFCSSRYPLTRANALKYFPNSNGDTAIEGGYMFLGQKSNALFLTTNMFMRFFHTYDPVYARMIYPFLKEVSEFWEDYLKYENGRYVDYDDDFWEVGPWTGKEWRADFGDINPTISLGLLRMFFKSMPAVSEFLKRDLDKQDKWKHILAHLSNIPMDTIDGAIRIKACEGGNGSGSRTSPGFGRVMMQGLVFPAGVCGELTDRHFDSILQKEIARFGQSPRGDADWYNTDNGLETYFTSAIRVGYDPVKVIAELKHRISQAALRNLWLPQQGGGIETLSAIPSCVNEMLLQGYEGVIRIFPAWPRDRDASFEHLRAVGAFLVSASLEKQKVRFVRMESEQGRDCNMENPWKDKAVVIKSSLNYQKIRKGRMLNFHTVKGEKFTLYPVGQQTPVREKLSLDKGWLFHLGDIPFPAVRGHAQSYLTSKAGVATGAAAIDYDAQAWQEVTLPHDWAVESPYDSTENLSQGYRKRGYGWYRRAFALDSSDNGKNIELQFDGIATHCEIWVNGILMHRNFCGYTSSYVDISPIARYGGSVNIIAVRVDAESHEGWWYEGAGIYRHTWLVKRQPLHIITDGVYANPVRKAAGQWLIPAAITLESTASAKDPSEVDLKVLDQQGHTVSKASAAFTVPEMGQNTVTVPVSVTNPVLWTLEHPVLYHLKVTIRQNGRMVDELTTTCGFRTIRFTADSGFYLNDVHVKIKGVCNHQDHAGVGVAVPDALWEFRLRKLKEIGVNGYRCSHNPPAAEFLEACDSLGILVMDENRNFNTSPEYIRQLQWMVRRDRNHPSIILWSVFNEEPMQGTESGYRMVRAMSASVKELDTTRPVTAAQSDGQFAPANVSQAVDVVGFNYQMGSYDPFHRQHPMVPITSSEDGCAMMTRDIYITDKNLNLVDAYDDQKPGWGSTHREAWKAIDQRPFVAGCFVWSGFDYRGEPTPYTWPSAASFFGIMDQCGFPKTAFWLHQAQWREDLDVLHLVPYWNWPEDSIGKKIKVMSLTNADSIQLILNGKKLAGQKVDKYEMNSWQVAYQPGKLQAIGYKKGKIVSRFETETTGLPETMQLIPYRKSLAGDGWDAMPVTVQVLDHKGRPVPTSNIPVTFTITGNASIIGLGNGDPNSHEPEKGYSRSLFQGLAQVIIQSKEGGTGTIVLTASSKGVKTGSVTILLDAASAHPFVEPYRMTKTVETWLMSPATIERPDPLQKPAENDMNSWTQVKPGQLQVLPGGRYVIFRARFTPYAAQQKNGASITLQKLTGKAEIWLDGKLVKKKDAIGPEDVEIPLPAIKGSRELNLLFDTVTGDKLGLGGMIWVK